VCWGLDDSSSSPALEKILLHGTEDAGNIKMPVSAGRYEDTDVYVEPSILVDPQIL